MHSLQFVDVLLPLVVSNTSRFEPTSISPNNSRTTRDVGLEAVPFCSDQTILDGL